MKQAIIAALAVVAIIAGAVMFGGDNKVTADPSNHFYGQESGKLTLTVYGDFECPACGSFAPIVDAVKEEFKDEIRFEFINYPLVQIHQNAISAHRAAEAASNQGKFWEMHDLLYARQSSWNASATTSPSSTFESYAQELGLDIEKFKTDVAASETLAVINADIAKGKALNITGTPSFFVDGVQIENQNEIASVDSFKSYIQNKLDEKSGTPSTDTPSAEEPTN